MGILVARALEAHTRVPIDAVQLVDRQGAMTFCLIKDSALDGALGRSQSLARSKRCAAFSMTSSATRRGLSTWRSSTWSAKELRERPSAPSSAESLIRQKVMA